MIKSARETNDDGQAMLYTQHPARHIFTDFNEIVRFDREFWEITKGLPVRTGSLMRLSSDSFSRWRIGLTEENRQMIKDKGDEFRIKDYCEMEKDSSIESMEATIWSTMMRNSMVRVIVHFAKEILSALDDGKREFNVCELASGYGNNSVSLAAAFLAQGLNDILARTNFLLVDYSAEKLKRAKEKLQPYQPASIITASVNDEEFLSSTDVRFDAILSVCHMHKRPFLGDLLEKAHGTLKKKGVIISGDWHSSLSDHPALLFQLLQRMGTDARKLRLFQEMLNDFMNPTTYPKMSPEEFRAVAHHQAYWASVYNEILSSPSAMAMKSR
ncbi:MAG: class I SAM-dependent methyltransferase, partial [Candidatus Micrarchaeota archaeon]